MHDLIDRGKLMEQFHDHYAVRNPDQNAIMDEVCMMLIKAPAVDAVPVVRCGDCKNWDRHIGIFDSPNGYCYIHEETVNGYDYCSYGERKNDG